VLTQHEERILAGLLVAMGSNSVFRPVCRLAGDGSNRGFCRLSADGATYLAVLPDPADARGVAEARAACNLGRHFHGRGAAVPEIFGCDAETGLLLMEDLGDVRLHDLILARGQEDGQVREYCRQALAALAWLQTETRQGFDPCWCWDTPRYDRQLMLARESGYFRRALCEEYLGLTGLPPGLETEFLFLAEQAAQEPADYVLHRDYQSRNLMVKEGRVRIIDFQGARLGPLGYDAASLLIDPYAGFGRLLQEELLHCYLDRLADHIPLDRARFLEGYYYMALQRNLQIAGAFAFLAGTRGKPFFRQYIGPALASLDTRLAEPQGRDFPLLRGVVGQAGDSLRSRQNI